jgi:CO/xanthine dehydrogenase Mo-binding subunit/ABC-type nitrate/sulfonate/bicarbonate transport system substrate-binding protein
MNSRQKFSSVGTSARRLDGAPKVTGATRYTADHSLPGMIWGKCLRSPLPHARIRRLDVEKARKLKGVFAVLTAADLPDRLTGIILKDMPVLASDRVRFIGERIAVIGAASPDIADEALNRIEVEYEELPAVYDPLQAMSAGAPLIHEELRSYDGLRLPLPDIPNLHNYVEWRLGDHQQGFADADFVFEQSFTTQRAHQGYLEPHAVVVQVEPSEKILIWSTAKQVYLTRANLSEWLGIAEEKIIFQVGAIGGDFGGKGTLMDLPLCYFLAKVSGRPAKMIMSYAEELSAANPRHASVITIKTGVKKDGRLWARELKAVFNGGAYAGIKESSNGNLPGARHGNGSYAIPHSYVQSLCVYTNCIPGGIMRGPGDLQVIFAVESHMDYVARRLGMDPYRFRRLNVLKPGDLLVNGQHVNTDIGLRLLQKMQRKIQPRRREKKIPYVGRGLALSSRDVNFGAANIDVGVSEDGAVYILTTVPDTGTGAHTIFRQLVAEALTIPAEDIEVRMGTTEMFPTDVRVIASLVTYLSGQAVQQAASALRDKLIQRAAPLLGCSLHEVRLERGAALGPKRSKVKFADLAAQAKAIDGSLSARGSIDIKERLGAMCFFAEAAEVRVDPETGQVKVRKVISAHDVGTIINPLTHRGQVEGGMIQGFGFAMSEDLATEDGKVVTANLGEYKLPNIRDIPEHETLYVRDHTGPGPFQAKQIGEHGAIPTAAAIANAVYDAIGVQIADLPITAEKVFDALRQQRAAQRVNAPSASSLRRSATTDLIKIVGFDKDITLSVAEANGFLAAENLAISFDQTLNSTDEILGLLDGKWDIAFDNGDNVVAWDEGQGADGKTHDLFIFLGGSQELNQSLFVTSDIQEIGDLKGKLLGADAVGTGFAVVLRYILDRHGLCFERDYSFKSVGSTRLRLAELSAGRIAGAMVNPGYVEDNGANNLRLLASGKDYADPYPARIGLTTRTWANRHRSLLVRFIRAMIMAIDWMLDARNKAELLHLIESKSGRSPEQAQHDYRRLFEPRAGLTTRGAFNPEGLKVVLELRRKLALIDLPLPPLEKYFDDSFYREALGAYRHSGS